VPWSSKELESEAFMMSWVLLINANCDVGTLDERLLEYASLLSIVFKTLYSFNSVQDSVLAVR
jgi:hypothetical protein